LNAYNNSGLTFWVETNEPKGR